MVVVARAGLRGLADERATGGATGLLFFFASFLVFGALLFFGAFAGLAAFFAAASFFFFFFFIFAVGMMGVRVRYGCSPRAIVEGS